jgi:hypothetical protein
LIERLLLDINNLKNANNKMNIQINELDSKTNELKEKDAKKIHK